MDILPSLHRRLPVARPVENGPRRNRVGLFVVVTFGAAALSGLAAVLGVGPLGEIGSALNTVIYGDPRIDASTLFPPVPPVHKVVIVYDPPASRPPAQPPKPVNSGPPAGPPPAPPPAPEPGDN